MAKKDFDREYSQVERDYLDMLQELRDMEKELEGGLVDPQMFDNMKQMAAPLIANYRAWNYIKFILDKPVKKSKQARHAAQNRKLLENCKTIDQIRQEDRAVISKIRENEESN